MDPLTKQVRRVQWRLGIQRFFAVLSGWWTAALILAMVGVVVDKFRPLGFDWRWWPAGAVLVGLCGATAWTIAKRHKRLDAAVELDRRFGLKERVSSSLALAPDERQSAAGQALLADAMRRIERVEVSEKFRIRPTRRILLPLLPALAIAAVAMLLQPATIQKQAVAAVRKQAVAAQVKRSAAGLKRKLVENCEQAKKKDLPEAERLFKKLQDATNDLATKPDMQQAMAKLNDLARQLQARRREVAGAESARQQLEQLKDIDKGPADKFAQAMRKGDVEKAIGELEKLRKEIAEGKLDDAEKEALAGQLDQMKDKLEKMAAARDAAQQELEKQVEQAKAEGRQADAEAAERQLDQMQQQAGQMQQMADAAQQLGKCAECLRKDQAEAAQEALDQIQQGMENLQQNLDEMQMLDGAMDQLADAKKGLGQEEGMGEGDQPGLGKGDKPGMGKGDKPGMQADGQGQVGRALGAPGSGIGKEASPGVLSDGKELDAKYYDSQVRQKIGPGAADVIGSASGPNRRGSVQQQIETEFEKAREGKADPLTGRQIPRKHRQHAQEYFDRLREGRSE